MSNFNYQFMIVKISIMTNKIEDAEEIVKILDNRSLD